MPVQRSKFVTDNYSTLLCPACKQHVREKVIYYSKVFLSRAILTFYCQRLFHSGFQSCILTPPIGHWEVSCDVTNCIFCKNFRKTEARNWTSGWTFLISVYWTDVLEMHVTVRKIVIWILHEPLKIFQKLLSIFSQKLVVFSQANVNCLWSKVSISQLMFSWAMYSSMTHIGFQKLVVPVVSANQETK